MFWARPAALRSLTDLNLRLEDFPLEAAQIDGTIMHGLERLVYLSAAAAQYSSATIKLGPEPELGGEKMANVLRQRQRAIRQGLGPSIVLRLEAGIAAIRAVLPGAGGLRARLRRGRRALDQWMIYLRNR